jgi:predicted MFS family arabinose efflux permease
MMAARAAPFQALQAELVPDEQRGALMSLSMATGQAGAGIGGAIAGAAYAFSGYPATAALAAAASLAIALLVWRALPETRRT